MGVRMEQTVISDPASNTKTHVAETKYSPEGMAFQKSSYTDSNRPVNSYISKISDQLTEVVGLDGRVLDDGFYTYKYDGEGNIVERKAKETVIIDTHDAIALGIMTLTGEWLTQYRSNAHGGKQLYSEDDNASWSIDLSSLAGLPYETHLTWVPDSGLDSNAEWKTSIGDANPITEVIDFTSSPDGSSVGNNYQRMSNIFGSISSIQLQPTGNGKIVVDAIVLKMGELPGAIVSVEEDYRYDIDGNLVYSEGINREGELAFTQTNRFDFQDNLIATDYVSHQYINDQVSPAGYRSSRFVFDGNEQVDEHHFRAMTFTENRRKQLYYPIDTIVEWSQRRDYETDSPTFAMSLADRFAEEDSTFHGHLRLLFTSYVDTFGEDGRAKLSSIVDEGFTFVSADHFWNYFSYSGKTISIDFGSNPDGNEIAELAQKLDTILNDIRLAEVTHFTGYYAYHIGNFVGATQLVEGVSGIDLMEQRELETQERWLRAGTGLISIGLSVFTGGAGVSAARGALKAATQASKVYAGKVLSTQGTGVMARTFAKEFAKRFAKSFGTTALQAGSGAAAGAADNAIAMYLSGGSASQIAQAAAMGGMMGLRNPKMAYAGLAAGIGGAALGHATGLGASNGYVLGGIVGSVGYGAGQAYSRMAAQGAGRAAAYAGTYAAAHGSFVGAGAGIGGYYGGWEGALQGAIYGDMIGSMATPMFVKCFVAGTPVLIPVGKNDRADLAAAEPVIAPFDESWNRWKLTIAGLIVPVGVAQYFAARRHAAEQSRQNKSRILTPWEFDNPNQKLIYGMD